MEAAKIMGQAGEEPRPGGRRAVNRAARAAFKVARDAGVAVRHANKLRHLAERRNSADAAGDSQA